MVELNKNCLSSYFYINVASTLL